MLIAKIPPSKTTVDIRQNAGNQSGTIKNQSHYSLRQSTLNSFFQPVTFNLINPVPLSFLVASKMDADPYPS